jgi:heme exporter protein D
MSGQRQDEFDGGGCAALVVGAIVLALVVMAVISIAALIDPFSWLPPVAEIWEECEDDPDTLRDDCDLAVRFPAFWPHVIANLVYIAVVVVLLGLLALAVAQLREARTERFSGAGGADRYGRARQELALAAGAVAMFAALPIIVAIV